MDTNKLQDAESVLAQLQTIVTFDPHYIFVRKSAMDRIKDSVESLQYRINRGDFTPEAEKQ